MCTCMWFALPRPRYTGQEEISSLPTGLFKSRPQLPPPSGLFADNASHHVVRSFVDHMSLAMEFHEPRHTRARNRRLPALTPTLTAVELSLN